MNPNTPTTRTQGSFLLSSSNEDILRASAVIDSLENAYIRRRLQEALSAIERDMLNVGGGDITGRGPGSLVGPDHPMFAGPNVRLPRPRYDPISPDDFTGGSRRPRAPQDGDGDIIDGINHNMFS